MHASIAVALAHDRYLSPTRPCRREALAEECFHRSRSTELFTKVLRSHPIQETSRKDAVWGTAAFLGILAFSAPAGTWLESGEDSWPLRSSTETNTSSSYSSSPSRRGVASTASSPPPLETMRGRLRGTDHAKVQSPSSTAKAQPADDLQWLLAKEGKMSLWTITNPLREDSIFRVMKPVYATMFSPLPSSGIEGIHPGLAALCGLDSDSRSDESPYFLPLHALSRLLNLPPDNGGSVAGGGRPGGHVTVGHTEPFMNHVQGAFRALLVARDPRALLLLYLWYRRAGPGVWWVSLRARVEGPAICEYLERYCCSGNARGVLDFLPGGCFGDEACFTVHG